MKDGFLDHAPTLEVFHNDALQQLWSDRCVPNALRIYHHYRTAFAHAQTWRFAPLHALGPEKEPLAL